MPRKVEFSEYTADDGRDWRVIELNVDSADAVRFWANAFGHPERYFRTSHHTRPDGGRWTHYASRDHGWRGFTTEVNVFVDDPVGEPLDDETRARLAGIAGGDPAADESGSSS